MLSGSDAALLRLKPDEFDRVAWPRETSAAWRGLAVSILHEALLRPLLGITDAKLDAGTHVDYTADRADAVRRARDGACQAAFLIAPTTAEELQAVVRGGELLPRSPRTSARSSWTGSSSIGWASEVPPDVPIYRH